MSKSADRRDEVDGTNDDVDVRNWCAVGAWCRTRLGWSPWTGEFGFEFSWGPGLERLASCGIDRLGILPVSFVQFENVPGIHSLERSQCHNLSIVTCGRS